MKGKWTYADAEDFFNELQKRKAHLQRGETADSKEGDFDGNDDVQSKKAEDKGETSPTRKFLNKISDKQYASKFSVENQQKGRASGSKTNLSETEGDKGFAAVLGLPPITVESLYMQYKEKDESIIDIMNENANYIRIYEGYPEFHLEMQGL